MAEILLAIYGTLKDFKNKNIETKRTPVYKFKKKMYQPTKHKLKL